MDWFETEVIAITPKIDSWVKKFLRGNYSEDVVQDVLVRIIQYRDKFERGTNFAGWCYVITRNVVFDMNRKKRIKTITITNGEDDDLLEDVVGYDPCPDSRLELREMLERIKFYDKTGIFKYVVLDGHQYDEAAKHFCIAEGTVKSKISRIREKILDDQKYHQDVKKAAKIKIRM